MLDQKLRRFALRPLAKNKSRLRGQAYSDALAALDDRALAHAMLDELKSTLREEKRTEGAWKDPRRAKRFIDLAKILYASRRISTQEYVFYTAMPVEDIHDARWTDGNYDDELHPIDAELDSIRKEYALDADQYWLRGEGPARYIHLESKYETILERKLVDAFEEFGLGDLAKLKQKSPKRFDELRERGRRTVFHKDEISLATRDAVSRYEEEAEVAARAGAYSAAIICLGAAIEGLFVIRCLRSAKKAERAALALPKRSRPRDAKDASTWTFETLIEVCLVAGWLPPVETDFNRYIPAGLAHLLRDMRNYVHPGRQARVRPWVEADERDFKDAHAIYVVLSSVLNKTSDKKAKQNG